MRHQSSWTPFVVVLALGSAACVATEGDTAAEAGAPDATADASDSEIDAIERVLRDPSTLLTTSPEAPAFGDAVITALANIVPRAPVLGVTPNAAGLLGDPALQLPAVQALLAARPAHFRLRVTPYATSAVPTSLAGEIAVDAGLVVAHAVDEVEPGDAFVLSRPTTPAALARLAFSTSLDAGDRDAFVSDVFAPPGSDVVITIRIGSTTISIDTRTVTPSPILAVVSADASVAIGVSKSPEGPCIATRSHAIGRAYVGSTGSIIGEYRGVLWNGRAHAGFLRGVFGFSPARGKNILIFKAIDTSGALLFLGEAEGTPRQHLHGSLRDAAHPTGWFAVRGHPDPDATGAPFPYSLGMHLVTDCR